MPFVCRQLFTEDNISDAKHGEQILDEEESKPTQEFSSTSHRINKNSHVPPFFFYLQVFSNYSTVC